MKKNLIGAVAAGLALALAFTACESGNDNPIRVPTDADAAVYEKKTFDYKAAPTSYTGFTKTVIVDQVGTTSENTINRTDVVDLSRTISYQAGSTLSTSAVTNNNYTWTKYVDGINSYNKTTGVWSGKADKGTAIGDVVNTKYETISLNTVEKTGKWSKTSSKYEVRGLRNLTAIEYGDGSTGTTAHTYFYKVLTDTSAYDTLPYYILTEANRKKYTVSSTSYPYALTEFAYTPAITSVDWPYLIPGRATSHDAARAVLDQAIAKAKDVLQAAEAAVTDGSDDTVATKTTREAAVKAAKEVLAKLENLKNQSVYFEKGATYSILDTTTVDEKTTGSLKYYTADKVLIHTEDKAATAETGKAKTFKYALTNNYLNGSILITECTADKDKWVFTDASDYYYKNELRGVISADFPVATQWTAGASTTQRSGSAWQKAGRTLNIVNGVLTGTGVDVNYTNHQQKYLSSAATGHALDAQPWGRTGYFIGSSYNTFELFYSLFQGWTNNTTTVDAPVSYSYKLQ